MKVFGPTSWPCIVLLLVLLEARATIPSEEHRPTAHYINLDRRPDRRAFMEAEFDRHGVHRAFNVSRFRAFDGKATEFTPAQLALFDRADFKGLYNFNVLVANQLSHLSVWEDLLASAAPWAVVLQDDAALAQGFVDGVLRVFQARPDDAAVIWIGLHHFASGAFSLPFPLEGGYDPDMFSAAIPGNDVVGRTTWNPCSLGYVLTRPGARWLVDHFRATGFSRATDNAMNDALTAQDRQYISRRVLCTGHGAFMHDSDIFGAHDQPSLAPVYTERYRQAEKARGVGEF